MSYLIETNILVRLANLSDPDFAVADSAVAQLHQQGEVLRTAPQNLIEFRNTATRPAAVNGLGLLPADVEAKAAVFEAAFPILPETPEIFPAWKALVQATGVIGKQVHDARLVAVCHVHSVTQVLTFNVSHFQRLAAYGPGLIVISPHDI